MGKVNQPMAIIDYELVGDVPNLRVLFNGEIVDFTTLTAKQAERLVQDGFPLLKKREEKIEQKRTDKLLSKKENVVAE